MTIKFGDQTSSISWPQAKKLMKAWPGKNPDKKQYPCVHRSYDIDQTCQKLVDALRALRKLPDEIDIVFHNRATVRLLKSISGGKAGSKWRIKFGRPAFGNYNRNICSAPNEITLPEMQIELYQDGSMNLWRYAGKDWLADEDRFMNKTKILSRHYSEGKWYLRYLRQPWQTILFNDADNGNDYRAEGDEPVRIDPYDVFKQINAFLNNVIEQIQPPANLAKPEAMAE